MANVHSHHRARGLSGSSHAATINVKTVSVVEVKVDGEVTFRRWGPTKSSLISHAATISETPGGHLDLSLTISLMSKRLRNDDSGNFYLDENFRVHLKCAKITVL